MCTLWSGRGVSLLLQSKHLPPSQAQSIAAEKSRKVLTDVIKTMYDEEFVTELFRPQAPYTLDSARAVFDKIAHSSIMRLNKTSMDKLYDLMTMGIKHQVAST